MNSARRLVTTSQLLESLEQRTLFEVGYFEAGIDINQTTGSESAYIYNSFGDANFDSGQINTSNLVRSNGTNGSTDVAQFSTTTKLRGELVFSAGGGGSNELDWSLSDGSNSNVSTPYNDRVRLAFDTSFTGEDRLRVRFLTRQATDLTLADRNGNYAFSGIIYDSDDWNIFPTYGFSSIDNGVVSGSEFNALGEIPLSATIGSGDAFPDGFTLSSQPGYTSLYNSRFSTLTTGFNQGPSNNFSSLTYAIRTDGTQPGINDHDSFRGDEFAINLFGVSTLFPELFTGGFAVDGGMSLANLVLQFDASGNQAHFYEYNEFYDSLDAQPISTGTWELTAGVGLRYETQAGLSINLRYGGDNGDELVGEMISDGTNQQAVFAVGTKTFDGTPQPMNTDPPADAGVCFTGVTTKVENGEHFIVGTGDDGKTYTWKVRDIEGSTESYVFVSASLKDNGKTIVSTVLRGDGQSRQLERPMSGEWEVKGDGSASQTVAANAQVDNAIDRNPVTDNLMQVAINTSAGTAEVISPSNGANRDLTVSPINVENGFINCATGFDIDIHYDAEFTTWSAYHGAFLGTGNEIWMLWNSPALGANYRVDNIGANASAPAADPDGRISVATTTYGTIHVGYTTVDGDYAHIYWNIGQGGNWLWAPLETAVGAPAGGLNWDPASVYTGYDYNAGRIFAVGRDDTTNVISGIDWQLGRQQWQYIAPTISGLTGEFTPGGDIGLTTNPVLLPSSSTMTLPGIFSSNQGSQIPVLGTLPIIGNLFVNSAFERQDTELTVFITPTLAMLG